MDNRILLPVDTLPLISLCDFGYTADGFVHPDRIMDVNVLLYVEKGYFEVNEEEPNGSALTSYTVNEGSLLFLKQGFHHYGTLKCPPGTKWFFVHFYLPDKPKGHPYDPLNAYLYKEGSPTEEHDIYYPVPKQITLDPQNRIVTRLFTLKQMFAGKDMSARIQINAYFYRILLDIFEKESLKNMSKERGLRIQELLDILDDMKDVPFSSEAICQKMNLSYKHLNILFKEVTGQTMQKYHAHIRMNEAARLLRETGSSISEISEQLGFEEPFYFSNSFKKKYGMSPQAYRKTQIRI